jgi:hypothetical protein
METAPEVINNPAARPSAINLFFIIGMLLELFS